MPYSIKRNGNKFSVENEVTGYKYSKATSLKKSKGQLHLLQAIDHGFVPMHNYHSKVIPRGIKKKSLEK
jgi:hypothetical protein